MVQILVMGIREETMTININITFHHPVMTGALLNGYLIIYAEQLIISAAYAITMALNIF